MGDSVLERNICFVDSGASATDELLQYMHLQLHRSALSDKATQNDLIGLLSGWGGSQVDVVLYLLSRGSRTFHAFDERLMCT